MQSRSIVSCSSFSESDADKQVAHCSVRPEAQVLAFRQRYKLAAGNGTDDEKRLCTGCDRNGEWGIWLILGQILVAGEKP